jgi:hypothetical protein
MSEGEQAAPAVWDKIKRKFFTRKTTTALAVLALILAFFAFHNGVWTRQSQGIKVSDVYVLGAFTIGNESLAIPVRDTDIRLSSSEVILIRTSGRTMNTTGNLKLENFAGKARWTGQQLILKGTMERAQSPNLDITWEQPENAVITMNTGLIDVSAMNLSSLAQDATGRLTLEGKWTAKLNQTPFAMERFEGRVYVQHVGEETILGFSGQAAKMQIKNENVLQLMT